jgi:NADH-quinone oxidoreductase subunit M
VLGAFLAQDLGLFVLFFDLMLVPFYFLVGSGAAPTASRRREDGRLHAVGSLLMLAAAAATAVLSARGPAS